MAIRIYFEEKYVKRTLDNLVILADLYQCKVDEMLVCEQF